MTTLSRRGFTLGLGASAIGVAVGAGRTAAQAAPEASPATRTGLTGHVIAVRLDPDTLDETPGLAVLDLATGEPSEIDAPIVRTIYPHDGTARAVARVEGGAHVVDAAAGTATEITPHPDGATDPDKPFADTTLLPLSWAPPPTSPRYAVLADGALPRWLIDLDQATVVDLVATFAGDDPFFQVAQITADGRLLLGTSDLVVLVDPVTLTVEQSLSEADNIRAPQLSPGGDLVAFVESTGRARHLALRIVDLVGGAPGEPLFEDASGTLSFRWLTDEAVLVFTFDRYGSTILTRLDLGTGAKTTAGVLPGTTVDLRVVAGGTRAVASTDLDPTAWWLIDPEGGDTLRVSALDGSAAFGRPSRDARALLFGPDDFSGTGAAGQAFVTLNTATGEVRTLLEQVDDQFYTFPVVAPDDRTAAIGESGPAGEALHLCDLVEGGSVRLDGYLGAWYAPDGRHLLTRLPGLGNPLEIRTPAGDLVRELDLQVTQAWWLG